ncbi:MAG TPA: metallophosphoesterase family protein [Symbiobacteriaceae bacterium]
MRIAAFSDTHANAVALEAVIADLRTQAPDAVVCLGDITMRGPQPGECVDLVRSLSPSATVRGNYDHLFTRMSRANWQIKSYKHELALRAYEYECERLSAADQSWLGNLPTAHRAVWQAVPVELFHAAPDSLSETIWPWASLDDLGRLRSNDATRLVLFGHVHHAFVRQAHGFVVVNVGSVGAPFDGDNRASYAVVDISRGGIAVQLRRVAYDVERVIQVARERSMPDVDALEYGLRHASYPYDRPDRE